MKKIILARWVLLSVLALVGSVGLFGVGVAQAAKAADCLAGTAFNAAKAACVPCPVGQFSDSDGGGACLKCPNGHICPQPGTYNPEVCGDNTAASFDQMVCINCYTGFHSSEASQCTSPSNEMNSCCQLN